MVMRMLDAGGVALVTDGARTADAGNPHGYFEDRRTMRLAHDVAWLAGLGGQALKIVVPLVRYLPEAIACDLILVRRELSEVLASQRALLALHGRSVDPADDPVLQAAFAREIDETRRWAAACPDLRLLEVAHREAIAEPAHCARRLAEFLRRPLDCAAMAQAVDGQLYRQRRGG